MPINKKEFAKLSPEQRIKKLKSMEEERKKEVTEIGRLIKESMQELRTDKIAEEFAPDQRPVDISKLFETTGEERLEKTAREEAPTALMKGTRGYQAIEQLKYDYSQLKKLDMVLSTYGNLTEEQKRLVNEAGERLNMVERYMTEGEKYATILGAGRAIVQKLRKETGLD